MRFSKPGDYGVVAREVENLESQASELLANCKEAEAELQAQLGQDEAHYDESEVRDLRRQLAKVEDRHSVVEGRIAALKAKLPSDEERQTALATAEKLVKGIQTASKHFHKAWADFRVDLARAEESIGKLSPAREEARSSIIQLEELVARYGLDIAVPVPPEGADVEVAYLMGVMITQAAYGEVDDIVTRDIVIARRKIAS